MNTFTIRESAKVLRVRVKWLYCALRKWDMTTKANLPSDRMLANGYMHIEHTPYLDNFGKERQSAKATFTPSGLAYLDDFIRLKAPASVRVRDSVAANDRTAPREIKRRARALPCASQKAC